jgi:hypothetical protein
MTFSRGTILRLLLCGAAIIWLATAELALAGFGITPPYVRNTSLTRNSTYEQQILLVRSDPSVAQVAEVGIDAPELEGWIQVIEGNRVRLEPGIQKTPITVQVNVPADAEFTDYEGTIRIRTVPDGDTLSRGAVNISLGAIVDIDLQVIDKQIKDFRVRKISVAELNEGSKLAWLFFPGKIQFDMLIENTGNVPIAPSRTEFRIFDRVGEVLLEETNNINGVDEIDPYSTDTVTAEIPTRLPAGSYIARYQIFNEDELKQQGDLTLTIQPAGTVQAAGFGFVGLSMAHKISVLLPIFAVIIAVLYLLFARRKTRSRK